MTRIRGHIRIIDSFRGSYAEAWQALCQAVRDCATGVPALIQEALSCGAPHTCEDGIPLTTHAMEFSEMKCLRCRPDAEEVPEQVITYAVCGNREYAHSMLIILRAFERLVLRRMHIKDIAVTIDSAHVLHGVFQHDGSVHAITA